MGKVVDRELEIPYTIIGHTSLIPRFSITLKGEGIKKVVSQLKKNEDLRIVIGDRFSDITAVRFDDDGRPYDVSYYKEDKHGKQELKK